MTAPLVSLALFLSHSTVAWEWNEPPFSGNPPSPRAGLSLSPLSSSDLKQSIICGGQNELGLDIAGCHLLSPLDGWKFQEVIGSADTAPRSDHTALIYESNRSEFLILYGGISNQTTVKDVDDNNGCEVFSTSTWLKVDQADCDVDNAPEARYAHSASLIGTLWLIFGGFNSKGDVIDDGVQALDFLNFPKLSWVKRPGNQLPVPPRAYHASASFSNGTGSSYLFISGGQGDRTGQILYRDVWIFGPVPNVESLRPLSNGRWSSPKMADSAPIYGHRIVIVGARLYAYGGANPPPSGVSSLDTNEFTSDTEISWSALPATGSSPQAMFRSSITTIDADGSADLELLVFGGCTVGPNPTFSGTLSVLTSAEGGNSAMRVNLPAILGGSTVAVLFIGAVLWFLLRNSNKSRMIRMESDVFSTQQNQYSYQTAYSSKQAPLVDEESEETEGSIKEDERLSW